jgi:hypothetical protein
MTTKFGVNLLVDPGAEKAKPPVGSYETVVPIPGWTTAGGMTADYYGENDLSTAQAAPGGGKNYFYGGPNNASSSASQTITFKGLTSKIKTGQVTATISGYLGGYGGQTDHADINVSFLNASGKVISMTTVSGPTSFPSGSSLSLESETVAVPKGTASVTYTLVATREQGADNDGLADNLSFVLNDATASVAAGKVGQMKFLAPRGWGAESVRATGASAVDNHAVAIARAAGPPAVTRPDLAGHAGIGFAALPRADAGGVLAALHAQLHGEPG